jgi:hypothetical protein
MSFLAFVSIALLASLIACACQSASGAGSGNRADLKLSFNVLGASATTKSGSSASKSISRLLLSSASKLTVSLTPLDSGLATPDPQTAAIASSTDTQVVSVSFPAIEYGNYSIKAVASDSSGAAQFQRSSTVTVSESTPAVALTLVPANVDVTAVKSSVDTVLYQTVSPGASYTWSIPEAALSSSTNGLDGWIPIGQYRLSVLQGLGLKIYAQNADGTLFLSGDIADDGSGYPKIITSTDSSGSTNVAPSSSPSYLTVFNSASSPIVVELEINQPT